MKLDSLDREKHELLEELARAKFSAFRHDKNFIKYMLRCVQSDIDYMYEINQRETEFRPDERMTYDECKEMFFANIYFYHTEFISIEDYMCKCQQDYYNPFVDYSPYALAYDPSYNY